MDDEDIAPYTYLQLIQSVWAESLCWNIHIVLARLSANTDWISCMYLAQYPRLPFCVLFYIYNLYDFYLYFPLFFRFFENLKIPLYVFSKFDIFGLTFLGYLLNKK